MGEKVVCRYARHLKTYVSSEDKFELVERSLHNLVRKVFNSNNFAKNKFSNEKWDGIISNRDDPMNHGKLSKTSLDKNYLLRVGRQLKVEK